MYEQPTECIVIVASKNNKEKVIVFYFICRDLRLLTYDIEHTGQHAGLIF